MFSGISDSLRLGIFMTTQPVVRIADTILGVSGVTLYGVRISDTTVGLYRRVYQGHLDIILNARSDKVRDVSKYMCFRPTYLRTYSLSFLWYTHLARISRDRVQVLRTFS